MSRYREAVEQLHTLAEIGSIMRSMQGLAFMEIRKLSRYLLNQQRVVAGIEAAAADYAAFYPLATAAAEDMACVYLVIGSERGFCGDYNEALLRALDSRPHCVSWKATLIIAVGRKLCLKLEGEPRAAALLDGPMAAEEIEPAAGSTCKARWTHWTARRPRWSPGATPCARRRSPRRSRSSC